MKIILFWSYYEHYINRLYQENTNLLNLPYDKQLDYILSDNFGWVPALAKRMQEQNCEVKVLIVNARHLQQTWAKENNCDFNIRRWEYEIPLKQVIEFQPDIIWIGSMFQYFGEYLQELRNYSRKIFAWIACPIPSSLDLSAVDCVLTSHPNFQQYFTENEKQCDILLPTFEPRILESLSIMNRDIECSFIGSLSYMHLQRMEILKTVATSTPIQIWSAIPKLFSKGLLQPKYIKNYFAMGNIRAKIHPSVWGMEMYRILAKSKMTINVHVDIASGFAGNIRMFEATGMGALLITEDAPNIRNLYEPDREIITYKSAEELVDIINYYVDHPLELKEIAKSGQSRTLISHSTIQRSKELFEIFSLYLNS